MIYYKKGELNPDGVITGDDEIGIKIYQDYMDELCESLKNNSLSLDADKINDSLQVDQYTLVASFVPSISSFSSKYSRATKPTVKSIF